MTSQLSAATKAIEICGCNSALEWTVRGDVYLRQGRFAEAISDFSHAVDLDDRFAGAFELRAQCYYELHQPLLAASRTLKGQSNCSHRAVLFKTRLWCHAVLNEFNAAEANFTKAAVTTKQPTFFSNALQFRVICIDKEFRDPQGTLQFWHSRQ
ncbi:MAG: tetratricopeptide repeat protein [Pirellulales bacterium]